MPPVSSWKACAALGLPVVQTVLLPGCGDPVLDPDTDDILLHRLDSNYVPTGTYWVLPNFLPSPAVIAADLKITFLLDKINLEL